MKKFLVRLLMVSVAGLYGCGGGSGTTTPTLVSIAVTPTTPSITAGATRQFAATGTYSDNSEQDLTGSVTWNSSSTSSTTIITGGLATAVAAGSTTITATSGNVYGATVAITTAAAAAAKAVTGAAINPVSSVAVGGATVSAFAQQSNSVAKAVAAVTPVATTTTNPDGSYTITGLLAGTTYYLTITASGFATFTYYNVNPDENNIVTLATARVIPSNIAAQAATASGMVKNASTNVGLPNMTVKIRSRINNHTGAIVNTTTTDSSGAYSFTNLTAGSYTAEVSGSIGTTAIITSYFPLLSIPTMTQLNSNQNFPVTTPLSSTGSGQYRIILNWGNNPRDLDSHLTGPTNSTTRFHVYYGSPDFPSYSSTYNTFAPYNRIAGTTTETSLDVDNTNHGIDNGPETTTIAVPRTGTYNYYVHHFGGTSNISASGAQVAVYKGSALLATFNPPAGASGDVWSVFSMTVTPNGETITTVNTISSLGTSSLAKIIVPDFGEYFLFSYLPLK